MSETTIPRLTVRVDDREDESTVSALEAVMDVEICHLEVGDFQVGDYVFEHKTPDDFWDSLTGKDQRLFRQIDQMKQTLKPNHYALLYSGDPLEIMYSNNGIAAVASCLVRGCPVQFCHDLDTMAIFLKYAFEKWSDGRDRSYNPSLNPRWYKDVPMSVITGIPFVQEEIGNKLLDKFGSVAGVANATIDQLQEVKGVGNRIAREIYNALHQPRYVNTQTQLRW